jgi:hypothetical protein
MLAIKGIYNNGQIKLTKPFARTELKKTMQVVVLFMDKALSNSQEENIMPPESIASPDINYDELEVIMLPKTELNYWNDEEVTQIGKIGHISQSFEEDGEDYSKW